MHFRGLWIEGAWIVVESFMESLRPGQLLNALVVVSLVALYTRADKSNTGKLIALGIVAAGFIVLWLACTIILHNEGL